MKCRWNAKRRGVIFRQPVNQPLQTGLKAVDAMIPIGRGQRELIIGDRQTGKTAIAIDTIINQRTNFLAGDPVYCIYVAIGQKGFYRGFYCKYASVSMEHWTIPLWWLLRLAIRLHCSITRLLRVLPLANISVIPVVMRWWFMMTFPSRRLPYREVSLILRRPSGREAYPGDIFYLHSRLLERAAKIISQEEVAREMNDLPGKPERELSKAVVRSRHCLSLKRRLVTYRLISQRT